MNANTRTDYLKMANEVIQIILDHLDRPLDWRDVAGVVCVSPFHAHRIFSALAGESINEMHRRLRLERACYQLKYSTDPIGEIAIQAGYGSHETFVRAFRAAFDQTPTESRNDPRREYHVRTGNGVHYFSGTRDIGLIPANYGEVKMEVEILNNCAPRRFAGVPHAGAYHLIGAAFEKLDTLASQHNLYGGAMIAAYYDSPELTPEPELRSAAAIEIGPEREIPEGMSEIIIGGGTFAKAQHRGTYSGLGDTWDQFSKWLLQNGYEFGDELDYELYLNDPSNTAPEDLLTDLYINLK